MTFCWVLDDNYVGPLLESDLTGHAYTGTLHQAPTLGSFHYWS